MYRTESWISYIYVPNQEEIRAMEIDELDRNLLQLWRLIKAKCKRARCCTSVWTKTPVYDRIRKLKEGGIEQRKRGFLEQSMLPFLRWSFFVRYPGKSEIESIESFSGQSPIFLKWKECYWMGVQVDFLLKISSWRTWTTTTNFLRQSLAALPNIFSESRVPFVFTRLETQLCAIYRKDRRLVAFEKA